MQPIITMNIDGTYTEWPDYIKDMKEFEDLLKCKICFEYYNAAVIIPQCSHNFCSLCIRKYMSYKTQCPTCFKLAATPDLRKNAILDDLVEKFKAGKKAVLCILGSSGVKVTNGDVHVLESKRSPTSTYPASPVKLPQSKQYRLSSQTPQRQRKRIFELEDDPDFEPGPSTPYKGKSLLRSSRRSVKKSTPSIKNTAESNEDVMIIGSTVKTKLPTCIENMTKTTIDVKKEVDEMSNLSTASTIIYGNDPVTTKVEMVSPVRGTSSNINDTVACPVCKVPVKAKFVNIHLDRCLKGLSSNDTTSGSSTDHPRRKPLSKLVYTIMKDKELKKRLKDIGLPTDGDRQAMIRRHRDYTILYNADCDSTNPKTVADLVQEVVSDERAKAKLSTVAQSTLRFTKKTASDDMDKAKKEYEQEHKSQYKSLIEDVKRRMKAKRELEKKLNKSAKVDGIVIDAQDVAGTSSCMESTGDNKDGMIQNEDTTEPVSTIYNQEQDFTGKRLCIEAVDIELGVAQSTSEPVSKVDINEQDATREKLYIKPISDNKRVVSQNKDATTGSASIAHDKSKMSLSQQSLNSADNTADTVVLHDTSKDSYSPISPAIVNLPSSSNTSIMNSDCQQTESDTNKDVHSYVSPTIVNQSSSNTSVLQTDSRQRMESDTLVSYDSDDESPASSGASTSLLARDNLEESIHPNLIVGLSPTEGNVKVKKTNNSSTSTSDVRTNLDWEDNEEFQITSYDLVCVQETPTEEIETVAQSVHSVVEDGSVDCIPESPEQIVDKPNRPSRTCKKRRAMPEVEEPPTRKLRKRQK